MSTGKTGVSYQFSIGNFSANVLKGNREGLYLATKGPQAVEPTRSYEDPKPEARIDKFYSNTFDGNTGSQILASGFVCLDLGNKNIIRNGGGRGINGINSALVHVSGDGNQIIDNAGDGIRVADYKNTTEAKIIVSGDSNKIAGNGGNGIYFAQFLTISGNRKAVVMLLGRKNIVKNNVANGVLADHAKFRITNIGVANKNNGKCGIRAVNGSTVEVKDFQVTVSGNKKKDYSLDSTSTLVRMKKK